MPPERSSHALAQRLGGRALGPDLPVRALRSPESADADAVVVLTGGADAVASLARPAAALVVSADAAAAVAERAPASTIIAVADPRGALATLSALFDTRPPAVEDGVHPSAVVDPAASVAGDVAIGAYAVVGAAVVIGGGSRVGPLVTIGTGCHIGRDCLLHAGVRLYDGVTLGDRVEIHSGAVLGADGFGYVAGASGAVKIRQLGTVEVGDDVEIGANTSIDRGTLGPTRIGPRSKIDNHCQIGHNVRIGADCLIAGMTGIAGSTRLGDRVTLGGYVAVADHLSLGDDVRIAGRSGVTKDVPERETWAGFPAQPYRRWVRSLYLAGQLERIWAAVKDRDGKR